MPGRPIIALWEPVPSAGIPLRLKKGGSFRLSQVTVPGRWRYLVDDHGGEVSVPEEAADNTCMIAARKRRVTRYQPSPILTGVHAMLETHEVTI